MQGLWLAHYCNPSIEQPPTSIEGMDSDPQSGDRLLASWCFARGSVVSFLFSYSTAVGNWSPGLSLPPHHSVFSRPQIPNPFPVLNHLFQAVIRPCLKIFAFLSHGGGGGGRLEINATLREASLLISEKKISSVILLFDTHLPDLIS